MSKELLERIKKEGVDLEGLIKCLCRTGQLQLSDFLKQRQLLVATFTTHLEKALDELAKVS